MFFGVGKLLQPQQEVSLCQRNHSEPGEVTTEYFLTVFSHIFGPCQFSRGVLGWMDWRQIRTAVIGVLVKIRIPQNTRISFFCWLYLVTREHLSLFYRHVKIWIVPVLVEKVIIEGFWFPAWDFVYASFLFSCSKQVSRWTCPSACSSTSTWRECQELRKKRYSPNCYQAVDVCHELCFYICSLFNTNVSRIFPAFLTIHVATLEFDAECPCPCRETGQISEVVMPMIWFEEVRLSLTHMEAVAVLLTLDRTLTLTLNPPGATSVSPLFPPAVL